MSTASFDAIAAQYDQLWTNTAAGRAQRDVVWRHIDPLFCKGDRILDLGCGTGEDALHLIRSGVEVSAFDVSPEMVRIARERGVDARVLAIEELQTVEGIWDGALSNFGALNCVRDICALRAPLARLIRPGGHAALCVMGRFCLDETLRFLGCGEFRKAVRRWSGESQSQSLGLRVFYPATRQIEHALDPDFTLVRKAGIGPGLAALADHRLLIFRRR